MPKIVTLLIITAYIVYFFLTPPLTTNDEPSHVKIISGIAHGTYIRLNKNKKEGDLKELGANRRLENALQYADHPYQIPTFSTVGKLKENNSDYNMQDIYSHEAYSPPFYYIVGALFYYLAKVTPYLLWQFYIMRLTSALFYFGTVYIAWKILNVIFKNTNTASSLLLLFAINPLVLKMGIGISTDIGVTFFSLVFLYLLLQISYKKLLIKNIIILSLVSALATMSKISGIFTNGVFILYLLWSQGFRKRIFVPLVFFEVIFFILTTPWFIFAFWRYGTIFPQPFTLYCTKLEHTTILSNIINIFATFRFTIMEYAGFMGEGWPFPFRWFFVGYVFLFVIFLIIGLWFIFKQAKNLYKVLLVYVTPLILLLLIQSTFYKIDQIDCPIQGRYILPIFLVLNMFVYWGIVKITKNENKASLLIRSFAIFQYLFILFTVLLLRYYV